MSSADAQMRRYLLGDLPEAESERLEEEYFHSDDRFGELLAVEDDLIDSFLQRTLTARDRERFEERFLRTERNRRKVAIAAALGKISKPETRERTRSWVRALAIAAAIALLTIGGAIMREVIETSRHVDQLANEVETLRSRRPRRIETAPAPLSVFPIVLRAVDRGTSTAAVVLPADASADLWLVLPHDDYAAYTAALQTVDGQNLLTTSALPSKPLDGRKAVVFHVPASSLQPATYVVAVSGDKADGTSEAVEDFSFTVRRP